jgi:dihydroorotase (multifunctional complex type)
VFDLGVEGGTVVTPRGRSRAHVYVRDGRVALLSGERQPARERVDASGLLVMPGMVDAHVHFMDPSDREREDFPTGTAAALRAGVTTVLEHTHSGPVRTPAELEEKRRYLADRSRADFGLGAHAWTGMADQVAGLWRAGAAFVKAFTCTTHGVPGLSPAELLALFEAVAAVGAVCLVHAEEESLTAAAERSLRRAGRADGGVIPAWRGREAEQVAVASTTLLARLTGARVVIAHASCPEVVRLATRERQLGAPVAVETCPQYLTLLESEVLEHGPFRKFTPPARARSRWDLEAMWQEVAMGTVDYVASDHAPSTPAQKRAGSIWEVHFGLPGIDTTLPVLLDAAHAGRIGYERVAEVYAEAPARVYGLFPRKGTLRPGADADLVLVDPGRSWRVEPSALLSRAGWSPFQGRVLHGRAVRTYLRGRLAAEEDRVLAEPGWGRFLPGAGAGGADVEPEHNEEVRS